MKKPASIRLDIRYSYEATTPSSKPFKREMMSAGLILLRDIEFDGKDFLPEFVEIGKPNRLISYKRIWRKAGKLSAQLGQGHIDYLLKNQKLIPSRYRYVSRGRRLLFPNVILTDPKNGKRYSPWLDWCWSARRWCLRFRPISSYYWSSDTTRLACIKKK